MTKTETGIATAARRTTADVQLLYALDGDGELLWYRHDGRSDGKFAWHGPTAVGDGWDFQQVFSGGAAPIT